MDHIIRQRVTSTGIVLAIISSLLATGAAGRALVSGPARSTGRHLVTSLPTSTLIVFVVAGVVLIGLLLIAATWAKLLGAAAAFALAGTEALMVTIAKTSTRFHAGSTPHLEVGGRILGVAFFIAIVGLIAMIAGARELVPAPDLAPSGVDAADLPVRSGNATVALGFSVLGVIFFPVAPVGVILGLIAFGQITQSRDRIPGRNVALTAAMVGTAWISLWVILIFATGIYAAPSI